MAYPPGGRRYCETVGPYEGEHGIALNGDGAEMVVGELEESE